MLTIESLRRPNFAPEEFFVSDIAKKHGINNYPPKELEQGILPCLMSTADMMQEIRDLLGTSIKINSAYRCKKLNDLVGSTDRSQHLQGLACDFVSPKFGTPEEIIKFLFKKKFLADQVLMEGAWIHISRKLNGTNRMDYAYYLLNPRTGRREKIKL